MPQNQDLHFDVYRLDVLNECVWRGEQMLHLTTKAFAVLQYLLAHAGRLVTKEELFQAVWPDIAVSDAALTICVSEIRKDGQPLFLLQVVEAWVQQGWVQAVDGQWTVPVEAAELEAIIPENVRQLIEQQFEGLSAAAQR